jgi:hypothetical protein
VAVEDGLSSGLDLAQQRGRVSGSMETNFDARYACK